MKFVDRRSLSNLSMTDYIVYSVGSDGKIARCNTAFCQLLGVAESKEIVGKSLDSLVFLGKEILQWKENNNQAMQVTDISYFEEYFFDTTRKKIKLLSCKIPVSSQSEVSGIVNCSTVFSNKNSEAFLQLKNENIKLKATLETLLDSLPGHVYWQDQQGVILGCNKNQANSLGYTNKEDVIGKNLFELVPKKEADLLLNIIDQVVTSNKAMTFEEQVTFQGEMRELLTQKVPLLDKISGNLIGVLGLSLDITEKKESEKELLSAKKQAEAYLQNAVEQIPAEIYWKNKHGMYLGCNSRFMKRLGLKNIKEIIGKTDVELGLDEILGRLPISDQEIMQSGKEEKFEETRQLRDGKKCIYLTKKAVLHNKIGDGLGVITISFDVTEHRLAEQQRLETLLSFGTIVAHEMRTPLTSISAGLRGITLNFAKLLNIEELSIDQKRAYKDINEILDDMAFEIKSAGLVIDMILENTKTAESTQLKLEKCLINKCIKETLSRYPLANKHHGLINFKVNEDFIFFGNEDLFSHILFNLIKNALYFIDASGKGEITIWTEKAKDMNLLHFKDTGSGIAEEDLSKIFNKFYSRRYHGVGLGLVFCKQVMNKFGGDINCRSTLGEYTEFVLSFPQPDIE